MRKLFFAICFNLILCQFVCAKVTQVTGFQSIPPVQQNKQPPVVKEINEEDFEKIVEEGLSNAKIADPSIINKNVSYIKNENQEDQKKEKTIFEKIYEQALGRTSKEPENKRADVATSQILQKITVDEQQQMWNKTGIPTVMANLPPNNESVEVPAMEHIPYLMNFIEVLPTGLVKFEETVVVVANGDKLRQGLTKILPTYIYNVTGDRQKLDYSIISVTVNDTPVDYHLSSDGDNVLMVPATDYELEPGIYTYKFSYVADNLLWNNNGTYQFYWDIGGNGWNLVVNRLGATFNLPQANAINAQSVLLGSTMRLSLNAVDISPNGPTAYSYVAKRPLFIGEGMHLIADIKAGALMPPTLWQKFLHNFYDNSDNFLAVAGFLLVFISFVISWDYIAKDKGQLKLSLNKTAMVLRYLLFDRFDIKSVCGFLLELYKKNIIDIQQSGDKILLVKRTDNLQSMSSLERKGFNYLFPSHETVFNITPQNKLPLKRFAAKLYQSLQRQMLKFRFKLNAGYLFLGLGIVVFTELFMAFFSYTPFYDFGVMIGATLICLGGLGLWFLRLRWWLKIIIRLLSLGIMLLGLILFAAVINPFAAILLILSLVVIACSLGIYSKRRGLIKHYINDVAQFKEYLHKHHDNILLGKDFSTHQAAIWALDLEDEFMSGGKSDQNKLPIVKNIEDIF